MNRTCTHPMAFQDTKDKEMTLRAARELKKITYFPSLEMVSLTTDVHQTMEVRSIGKEKYKSNN